MYRAIDIANYFISKSLATGIPVDQLKLLKLVYLSHGWYLGNTGKPLLTEGIEAWPYGPVVVSVYDQIKKHGRQPINEMISITTLSGQEGDTVFVKTIVPIVQEPKITQFLDKIWDVYKNYSGLQLSTLTHEAGSPWSQIKSTQGTYCIVPNDIIEAYYKAKIKPAANV